MIQIYEDETAECCSKSFWPGIKVTKIINNVVSYSLMNIHAIVPARSGSKDSEIKIFQILWVYHYFNIQ